MAASKKLLPEGTEDIECMLCRVSGKFSLEARNSDTLGGIVHPEQAVMALGEKGRDDQPANSFMTTMLTKAGETVAGLSASDQAWIRYLPKQVGDAVCSAIADPALAKVAVTSGGGAASASPSRADVEAPPLVDIVRELVETPALCLAWWELTASRTAGGGSVKQTMVHHVPWGEDLVGRLPDVARTAILTRRVGPIVTVVALAVLARQRLGLPRMPVAELVGAWLDADAAGSPGKGGDGSAEGKADTACTPPGGARSGTGRREGGKGETDDGVSLARQANRDELVECLTAAAAAAANGDEGPSWSLGWLSLAVSAGMAADRDGMDESLASAPPSSPGAAASGDNGDAVATSDPAARSAWAVRLLSILGASAKGTGRHAWDEQAPALVMGVRFGQRGVELGWRAAPVSLSRLSATCDVGLERTPDGMRLCAHPGHGDDGKLHALGLNVGSMISHAAAAGGFGMFSAAAGSASVGVASERARTARCGEPTPSRLPSSLEPRPGSNERHDDDALHGEDPTGDVHDTSAAKASPGSARLGTGFAASDGLKHPGTDRKRAPQLGGGGRRLSDASVKTKVLVALDATFRPDSRGVLPMTVAALCGHHRAAAAAVRAVSPSVVRSASPVAFVGVEPLSAQDAASLSGAELLSATVSGRVQDWSGPVRVESGRAAAFRSDGLPTETTLINAVTAAAVDDEGLDRLRALVRVGPTWLLHTADGCSQLPTDVALRLPVATRDDAIEALVGAGALWSSPLAAGNRSGLPDAAVLGRWTARHGPSGATELHLLAAQNLAGGPVEAVCGRVPALLCLVDRAGRTPADYATEAHGAEAAPHLAVRESAVRDLVAMARCESPAGATPGPWSQALTALVASGNTTAGEVMAEAAAAARSASERDADKQAADRRLQRLRVGLAAAAARAGIPELEAAIKDAATADQCFGVVEPWLRSSSRVPLMAHGAFTAVEEFEGDGGAVSPGREAMFELSSVRGIKTVLKAGHGFRLSSRMPSLSLNNCGLGDESIDRVAAAITRASALKRLGLQNNSIGSDGIARLAEALSDSSSVATLHLSGNRIGPEGAASLAQVIADSTTLTTVGAQSNGIGDDGAARLAEALTTNTSLTTLRLAGNDIGDGGAAEIAGALGVNRSLKTLVLTGNGLSADARARIGSAWGDRGGALEL